ncbi:SigE family RNA polymerase sigma factor [Micromonospora sp. WMMD558]|uniref:SigE family RNA polymerase sigma factor n=1 Tax=unclassified Micromonospora TaxID=2617518 RepID=UPI0012B45D58|nr:SigE family RNA polymerase sigma factor [Micromonospora sp. WMMC415]
MRRAIRLTTEDRARDGFADFVRAETAGLTRFAYLLTGDRHHAEDLVQVALARVAVRWERLDDPAAYLRRVLYTQAASWWRWLRSRPPERLGGAPPERASPDEDADLRLVLRAALARLTVRQRAVLVLRYYEDRTEIETAALLGCRVGTVKSQTRHALGRLRVLAPELAELVGRSPLEVTR